MPEERLQPRLEGLAVAGLACQHEDNARGLIDAPIGRVPIGTGGGRGGALLGFQLEITLAELARGIAQGEVNIFFGWGRLQSLDLPEKPVGRRRRGSRHNPAAQ